KEGLIFSGWDKDFSAVVEDMTVTAKYMQGVASNVTIAGTFNGWDPSATPLYYTTDKDKVTVKLTLPAGEYKFKIVEDGGSWYGNNGTINNTTGEYGWTMSNSDGDCTFISGGGEYLFAYTISTKTLQVGPAGAEFTVRFVDWDGSVLKTETVYSGSGATAPEAPVREGYTFVGWSADFSKVYSNLTVSAQYIQGTEVYKVTFVDTDGTVISQVYAAKGKSAKSPLAPVKNGYIFTGWDKSFSNVTSDMTVTAQYTKGTASKVSIAGTFNGWNADATPFLTISGSKKVSLQMNLTEGEYKFKIVNNGEWLGNWGAIADTTTTTSATGWEMDATAGDCTFFASGGTYIFTYTASTNVLEVKYMGSEYKVTFVDWDGTVLKTEIVEPGGSATAPVVTLSRPADDHYTYTYKGWDTKFTNVQAPLRVTAVYNANPKTFTVKFVNWNGAVLSTQYVKYGEAAKHPGDPTRAGYIFTWWDGDINYITGNTTFTAQYADNSVYIMGDFNDWQGTKLSSIGGNVYQGKLTLAPGQYKFKIKQGNDWYGNNGWIDDTTDYTSETGWDMSWDAGDCTLNASGSTYTFRFNSETKKLIITYVAPTYTVTFKNWNGTTLKTQYVKRGNPAYAPAEPTRTGYVFTGWDQDFSWISANMVITAQFAENVVTLMGDFNNWEGTGMVSSGGNIFTRSIELQAGTYKFKVKHADTWYGNNGTIENTTVTTSDVGWEMVWDAGDCTLNASGSTYTFRYNASTRMLEVLYVPPTYTVTFKNWNGAILKTQYVQRGNPA
ncbi:MAG: InlB B-repeat-containing protein, partial [Ruminococcus sp.]|nr:InlB B-repeat-containing protein [Ruminococcus sp.]